MMDIIVIVVILIFALIGKHRGLVKTAVTLGNTILSLICSFIISPLLSFGLKLTPLYHTIRVWVSEKMMMLSFDGGVQSQGDAIKQISWLPSFVTSQIKANNNREIYHILGVDTVIDYVSVYITNIIIGLIAMVIGWIIFKCILSGILKVVAEIIESMPFVSSFNELGGFIVGLIKGLLTVSIIFLLVPLFISNPNFSQIEEMITTSYLSKWLYENNLILLIWNQIYTYNK